MNRSRNRIIAFSLLTIYLATGLLCSYGYELYAQKEDLRQNNTETFHSVITGSLPGAVVQPKKQVTVGPENAYASKNLFTELSALLRSIDHSASDLFSHYSFVLANLPSRLARSTIIFPFHYFW